MMSKQVRMQTKGDWERELADVIEDARRRAAVDSTEDLCRALAARGVMALHVVWKKEAVMRPHRPLSADGLIRNIESAELKFLAWFDADPFTFSWVS